MTNDEVCYLIHQELERLILLAEKQRLKEEVKILDRCQMDLLKLNNQY